MTSNRILQLEDLLKREISQIILTKVKDDRFKSFNIIDVKAASDLSSAKVYFSIINGNESDVPEIKFLEKFSSMIRSQVASEVVLKKVPKLKFIYDNTLYEANSIDDLLKSLNESYILDSLLDTKITLAPCNKNSFAVDSPIPEEAPVTMTVFPLK